MLINFVLLIYSNANTFFVNIYLKIDIKVYISVIIKHIKLKKTSKYLTSTIGINKDILINNNLLYIILKSL